MPRRPRSNALCTQSIIITSINSLGKQTLGVTSEYLPLEINHALSRIQIQRPSSRAGACRLYYPRPKALDTFEVKIEIRAQRDREAHLWRHGHKPPNSPTKEETNARFSCQHPENATVSSLQCCGAPILHSKLVLTYLHWDLADLVSAFYNITRPTKAAAGNELGIFEDLGDMYSQTDLDEFFLTLAPYVR